MLMALVTAPLSRKEIAHLLGDLQRDIDLRLAGRGAEMRRRDEAGRAEQGAFMRRFGDEHVKRGTGDMAGLQRFLECFFIHQSAARAIDNAHAFSRLRNIFT